MTRCPSGQGADCNPAYVGSIPTLVSRTSEESSRSSSESFGGEALASSRVTEGAKEPAPPGRPARQRRGGLGVRFTSTHAKEAP
jgi:hypothetical protein